jgi:hypothetical protein
MQPDRLIAATAAIPESALLPWGLALKLDVALFCNWSLLDRDHLQSEQLRRRCHVVWRKGADWGGFRLRRGAKEPKNGLAGWVRMMPVQTRRPLTAAQLTKAHTFQFLKMTATWMLIFAALLRLIVWLPYHLWRVSRERKARHWLGE